MKLRIKGNTIRLRLLRSEVEQFADEGRIAGETSFGPAALRYSLQRSDDTETVHAGFENNEITILVPSSLAHNWTANEMVGFDVEQPIGDGEMLSIVVEKDFVCIDRPDDPDRENAYPNPSAVCNV